MKILDVKIKNFKRFTDLTISGIKEEVKLVLLVGSNGCGKSSLLDAFNSWYKLNCFGNGSDEKYVKKHSDSGFDLWRDVILTFNKSDSSIKHKKLMYFRTAYRNDSSFNVTNLSKMGSPYGSIRFENMTSDDKSVSQNYQRLIFDTVNGVYNNANNNKTVETLRDELIGQIKVSMQNVFDNLILNNIRDPMEDGSFFFEKGSIKSFNYENLSAGEKSAFDLLLDLHIKKNSYNDSVFFIDEPETHMHTSLQGRLTEEMYNLIPANSQLWLATHSIGVLRAAQKLLEKNPKSVAILDFSDHDFDGKVEITPTSLNKAVWEKFLSITLDDFAELIAPEQIILCEGSLDGKIRKNFDASIYNKIFGNDYPNLTFISGGCCNDLEKEDHTGFKILNNLLKNTTTKKLIDRDERSLEDIEELESTGDIMVLSKRHLESYLFDDEVIYKLAIKHSKTEKIKELIDNKNKILKDAYNDTNRRKPIDDVKASSGAIRDMLRKALSLTQCGNNVETFMRDTLAPLISRDMDIYNLLKKDIIDKMIN